MHRNNYKQTGYRQTGITLLEMLVVFALISLISVLLLQFSIFLTTGFNRASTLETRANRLQMFQRWYRDSTSTIVASLDESTGFSGSKDEMAGFTLSPVFGTSGVPTHFSWTLQKEDDAIQVWYQEANADPIQMYQWDADTAEFAYRPPDGDWGEQWPAPDLPPGAVPFRIVLRIRSDAGEYQILSAANVQLMGTFDYREFL